MVCGNDDHLMVIVHLVKFELTLLVLRLLALWTVMELQSASRPEKIFCMLYCCGTKYVVMLQQ